KHLRVSSAKECCPTCFLEPGIAPSTTQQMRRCGFSRPGAPTSMRPQILPRCAASSPDSFSASADIVKRSFARFVRPDGEGLFDVIDGPNCDEASIRPNQIFSVSLPHSPLGSDDQARVVRVCKRHLLTAYGLRSLAPGSPQYHTRYGGSVLERDGGYHQ